MEVKKSAKSPQRTRKASPDSMTPQQLHESMMDFARKVSANKRTARAFLERIGAPV
jgi:hypothetical protein